MTDAHILAGDLTANIEERVVSGLLLPFGEIGQTNLGRFSVEGPGIIEIPRDVSVLMANEDHSQLEPRAKFLTASESPAGVFASFKIGENPEGDDLLLRIDEAKKAGKPMALSAEVKSVVIQAGKAVSGKLTGAAFVARGAFPSAALLAAAVDTEEAPVVVTPAEPVTTEQVVVDTITDELGVTHKRTVTTTTTTEVVDGVTKTTVTEKTVLEEPEEASTEGGTPVGAATAPNTLTASAPVVQQPSKYEVFSILQAIKQRRASTEQLARLEQFSGPAEQNLFAALNDVKISTGVGAAILQPQWIGELYKERSYQRKYASLFNHADLTSLTMSGFKWTTKPAGGTWSGDKATVPTNTPATAPVTDTASRFAGGHDIAREFKDFNVEGFFESYYAAMTDSYEQWIDQTIVLTEVLAGATALEADNPSGLTIGAGFSALIDGAAAVIAADEVPSFAIVATALWKSMMKTPASDTLGYLTAALGLDSGSLEGFVIRPSSALTAGNILVGSKAAATVYELPGVPIRVEAPDMVKGGIDTGVFGYGGLIVNKATALQLVTPYTP
jgi:hypothetical protein